MKSLRIEPKHFALIVLVAAIAMAPMLLRGFPGGNDVAQNYEFAQTVIRAYESGDIWNSFDGMANDGMGEVRLRVYPPMAYYALALAFLSVGDWHIASMVVFFAIFVIGALGMFLFAAEIADAKTALAAAALYTFFPFHLNEIYNNFLYAQFAAGAILPFCFLFSYRVINSAKTVNMVLFAISFAFLLLTHLPLAVIGSLSLLVFTLPLLRCSNLKAIIKAGIAGLFGLLLSSFYWVRLIYEMSWARHSLPEYFSGIWSYKINFLLSERTFTSFLDDDLSLWLGDAMLIAALVICIPGIVYVIRSRRENALFIPVLTVFAFAIFMTTPLSMVVWENVQILQKIQFPWRWMSIVSFSGALIAGVGLVRISDSLKSADRKYLSIGVAAATLPFILLSVFVTKAGVFMTRAEFNEQRLVRNETKTYHGWWPVWAEPEAFARSKEVSTNGREVYIDSWVGSRRTFSVGPGEPQKISLKLFYYPLWQAWVNGSEVEVGRSSDGVILLPIGSEHADISLLFIESRAAVTAKWASVVGWLVAILLLISLVFKRGRNDSYS